MGAKSSLAHLWCPSDADGVKNAKYVHGIAALLADSASGLFVAGFAAVTSFAPPLLLGPALPFTRLLAPGLRLCRSWEILPHACLTVAGEEEFPMPARMAFYLDAGGGLIFERIASKSDSKFLAVDDSHSCSKSSASRSIRTLNIWFDTKTLSNPPRPSNHLSY